MPIFNDKRQRRGSCFDLLVFRLETPACPTFRGEMLEKRLSSISADLNTPGLAAGHLSNFSLEERGGSRGANVAKPTTGLTKWTRVGFPAQLLLHI